MLRHTWLSGVVIFTALALYRVVADVCDLNVYAEPCGENSSSASSSIEYLLRIWVVASPP